MGGAGAAEVGSKFTFLATNGFTSFLGLHANKADRFIISQCSILVVLFQNILGLFFISFVSYNDSALSVVSLFIREEVPLHKQKQI